VTHEPETPIRKAPNLPPEGVRRCRAVGELIGRSACAAGVICSLARGHEGSHWDGTLQMWWGEATK